MQRQVAACPLESPCARAWQPCRRCRLCCALQLHWSRSRSLGLSPGSPPCLGQLQDVLKGSQGGQKGHLGSAAPNSKVPGNHLLAMWSECNLYAEQQPAIPWQASYAGFALHVAMTSAMVGTLTSRAVVWGSRGGPGCGGPGRRGHEFHASHGRRQRAVHGSVCQPGGRIQACARARTHTHGEGFILQLLRLSRPTVRCARASEAFLPKHTRLHVMVHSAGQHLCNILVKSTYIQGSMIRSAMHMMAAAKAAPLVTQQRMHLRKASMARATQQAAKGCLVFWHAREGRSPASSPGRPDQGAAKG